MRDRVQVRLGADGGRGPVVSPAWEGSANAAPAGCREDAAPGAGSGGSPRRAGAPRNWPAGHPAPPAASAPPSPWQPLAGSRVHGRPDPQPPLPPSPWRTGVRGSGRRALGAGLARPLLILERWKPGTLGVSAPRVQSQLQDFLAVPTRQKTPRLYASVSLIYKMGIIILVTTSLGCEK